MKIGFIGTGVMGNAISVNLLKAGYEMVVYNRTKSKTDNLVSLGASWADSPKEVAQQSDIIFTMVGFPPDVEDVYFNSETGIFAGAKPQSILVDMTTSRPSLAQKIYQEGQKRNLFVLDAPVSGGDVGAKNGTLTVMVGGDKEAFDKLTDIFEVISQSYYLFGPAGSGQHAKMANQIMIAGTMTGLTEMLVYAKKAGLDLDSILTTVGAGSAANWSLSNYGPRILASDYTPGFFAKHFLKDLRIALDSAKNMGISLPATEKAEELYQTMVDEFKLGNDGTQGLIKIYD